MHQKRAEALKTIDGFPAILCPKCHGEGIIAGYQHVDGGECFACQGKGNMIAPEHAVAYAAYRAAVKAAREVAFGDVKVGDELIYHGRKRFVVAVGPANYDPTKVEVVTRSGMRAYGAPGDTLQRYVGPDDLPEIGDYLK